MTGIYEKAFALTSLWCVAFITTASHAQSWFNHTPRDYEECAEIVERAPLTSNIRGSSLSECNTKFAGRRKPGGGYVYFDFMQNHSFDIAGPNPTPDELKQMDQKFLGYLAQQKAGTTGSDNQRWPSQQALDSTKLAASQAGSPQVVASTKPLRRPIGKKSVNRKSASCEDNSFSCNWSKLSIKVKTLLAPSPKSGHPPKS